MAQKTLTTSYLAQLTNANHDGVTQQIDDRLQGFESDNMMLQQAMSGVHTARQGEDAAYRRYSGKDFACDDLKREDALEDKYMSTIRALLNALLCLPEDEPLRRKAEMAVQLYKDLTVSSFVTLSVQKMLYALQFYITPLRFQKGKSLVVRDRLNPHMSETAYHCHHLVLCFCQQH